MKNKLEDLNNHLFLALERINEDDLNDEHFFANELKRAKAITALSSEIIKNANVNMKFAQIKNDLNHLEIPEMFKKAKEL